MNMGLTLVKERDTLAVQRNDIVLCAAQLIEPIKKPEREKHVTCYPRYRFHVSTFSDGWK